MNELQHSSYTHPSEQSSLGTLRTQKHAFRYLHSTQSFSCKNIGQLLLPINLPLRSAPIPIIATAENPQYHHNRYSLSLPPIASLPFQLMPLVFLS